MAYRMQAEATDAFDINKEPQTIRELYGRSAQGNQMLIARRLIERGVRFVQVWAGGWDHHQDIEDRLPERAKDIDLQLWVSMEPSQFDADSRGAKIAINDRHVRTDFR